MANETNASDYPVVTPGELGDVVPDPAAGRLLLWQNERLRTATIQALLDYALTGYLADTPELADLAAKAEQVGLDRLAVAANTAAVLSARTDTLSARDIVLGAAGGGHRGYATLAALNADLAWPASTIAEVYADGANNGAYVKSGASGSGSWSRFATYTIAAIGTAIAAEVLAREALEKGTLQARRAAANFFGVPPSTEIFGSRHKRADAYRLVEKIGDNLVYGISKSGAREFAEAYIHKLKGPPGLIPQNVPPVFIAGCGIFDWLVVGPDWRPKMGRTSDGVLWGVDPQTKVFVKIGSGGAGGQTIQTFVHKGGRPYDNYPFVGTTWPAGTKTIDVHAGMGQSTQRGDSGGFGTEPVLTPDPPYPDKLFMLKTNQAVNTAHVVGDLNTPWVLSDDEFLPLKETRVEEAPGIWLNETSNTAYGKALIDKRIEVGADVPPHLFINCGVGGANYGGIRKGMLPFAGYIGGIKTAQSIARKRGLSERVVGRAIYWKHGEADAGRSRRHQYRQMLLQACGDVNDLTRALTGQPESVPFIVIQPSREGNGLGDPPEIGEAMLDAAAMDPRIIVVGSCWHIVAAAGDPAHPGSLGNNILGRMAAAAYLAHVHGEGYTPIRIARAWRPTANTFRVRYNYKVTLDTSGLVGGNPAGTYLADDNGASLPTVSALAQVDDYTIGGRFSSVCLSDAPSLCAWRRIPVRGTDPFGTDFYGNPIHFWPVNETVPLY